MQHLAQGIDRINAELIGRRNEIASSVRGWSNVVGGFIICLIFAYFVYVQYEATIVQTDERKYTHIPFTPIPWLSATRNVRMEEYGQQLQPAEIEARNGV